MNRAERRRVKKSKSEQVEKAIKNLNTKTFIEALAEQKFNTQFQRLSLVLNDCTSALFIDLFQDKSLKEIIELQDKLGDMMLEQFQKENKLIEEFGGIEGMKKAVEGMEEKVTKVVTDLIKKGAKQKESIEILVSKFPKLSKNQLTHAYKQVKEQLKEQEEKQIEEGAEKIMNIIDHKEKAEELPKDLENKIKETAKIAAKNIEEMVEESEEIIEPKEVVPEEVKESKFKPILMKFKGQYGTYTKDSTSLRIRTNDKVLEFKTIKDIQDEENRNIEAIYKKIEEIKKCYQEFKEAFEV